MREGEEENNKKYLHTIDSVIRICFDQDIEKCGFSFEVKSIGDKESKIDPHYYRHKKPDYCIGKKGHLVIASSLSLELISHKRVHSTMK